MKNHIFALIFLFLAGCSFTSTGGSLKGKESHDITLIALLPAKVDGDISRERVDLLQKLVRAELQGKGFLLVDDQVVRKICSDTACPNKKDLVAQYGVQAIVENEVDSIARANFLAGYVNSVSGNLRFMSPSGEELFTVSHTKRERGGLLFNTGQIAQAVIQIASNAKSDESFSILAGLYAKDLVDEVPSPARQTKAGEAAGKKLSVEIAATQVTSDKDGGDRVCLTGTPGAFGSLVYRRVKTTLREVAPGEYCGLFRLSDFPLKANLAVELASPYGGLAHEPLKLANADTCELNDAVKLSQAGRRVTLEVACDSVQYRKFLVYRASGAQAPFQKVGEIKGNSWAENSAAGARYAIVAVSKEGELTSPIVLSSANGTTQS